MVRIIMGFAMRTNMGFKNWIQMILGIEMAIGMKMGFGWNFGWGFE